jgi:GNAT acetyltransferase-like protein
MKSKLTTLDDEEPSPMEKQKTNQRPQLPEGTPFALLHEFPRPELEIAWRELLARVEFPSHYTSPEFFNEPYFDGKQPFAILALEGKLVTGVLVGIHEGTTVTCGLPTRPQIQIDPQHNTSVTIDALMRGLEEESRGSSLVSLYTWAWAPLPGGDKLGYRLKILDAVPVLDLRQGPECLLKQCDKKRRNSVRYAIKNDVEVVPASTPEDYATFYDLYRDWCAAKRVPCYSYEMEQLAFRRTRSSRRLFLAKHSGMVIAGSVFRFFPGGLIEYSRNSSRPEYLNLKPNDILVWRAIEWACEQGFVCLSMGGAHRFLREFGGSAVPILRYRLDRTLLSRHDRKEALVDAGRECLRRLSPPWETRIRHILGKERPPGW